MLNQRGLAASVQGQQEHVTLSNAVLVRAAVGDGAAVGREEALAGARLRSANVLSGA